MTSSEGRVALIVGGTGMLRLCSETIASTATTTVLVARSKHTLEAIAATHPNILPLSINYTDDNFIPRLFDFLEKHHVKPNLCVLWMHKSGSENKHRLLQRLDAIGSNPIDVFDVCSSSVAQPGQDAIQQRLRLAESCKNISYHVIVLGFKVENNFSRWLTDEEISKGTLEAVQNRTDIAIVGQVEPWNQRP